MAVSHVVLLPVKPPAWGKSRLGELPDAVRRDLAEAFALDTLQACLDARGVDAVLVLTDDPLLATWQQLHGQGALNLRVMENVGMEASAQLVWGWANALIRERDGGRSCCWKVEARENETNAACFEAVPDWFGA